MPGAEHKSADGQTNPDVFGFTPGVASASSAQLGPLDGAEAQTSPVRAARGSANGSPGASARTRSEN